MKEIRILFSQSRGTIQPEIYGHFSEHIGGVFYDGLWVGEDSKVENVRGFRKALVDSFRKIHPPVLRWPGGCFAETYDWRDGIGPRNQRPERVNWWYYLDGRTESNAVGTHEFVDFCNMVGAEPYFAANATSTYPLNIRNWMEYCNAPEGRTTLARQRAANGHPKPFNVKYWGIGNENWGGGGQMTPERYAREYLRYATTCSSLRDGDTRFIACGACGDRKPGANRVAWTSRLMQELADLHAPLIAKAWALSLHYYCGTAGTPQEFTEDEWYQLLSQADYMRCVIDENRAAMDPWDHDRKIRLVVDEWGCWHQDGTGPSRGYNLFEQQSSMRDAVVAAMTLNIFNNRCDVVAMANVAQLCNNLHCLFLAGGEHFVETPTYFVYDLFKRHQGARQLEVLNDCGAWEQEGRAPLEKVSASASEAADGRVTVTLANLSCTESAEIALSGVGRALAGEAEYQMLAADDLHACNTFEAPETVKPCHWTAAFRDGDAVSIPAGGVLAVTVKPKETGRQEA